MVTESVDKNNFVRRARIEDVDAIHHILDVEPFKYDENLPYDRSWLVQLVENERCITLVYESDGMIKGFISGEKMVSGAVMIWFCAVKKEFQNSIIGIKLYLEFEKICRVEGVTGILAYGYKTSAGMLKRLNFFTDGKMYQEFFKILKEE
jgi:ribosomal protein S18 acetylase RimI-like enzyme